ncbi:MAG TPA: single-stranded DNA-binding protein [Lactobacillus sp.]|nr:single-stranded DNA-binding protein [Lactobacillus sp.]
MINRVVLVGRLTRDPELRYTRGNAAVANFTVAVNRTFTNSQGEREADFISCIIWRKAAENFVNFTKKGSLVGIDGRIQTSSYEKDGQRVYRTDVIVENFSLLESREDGDKRREQNNKNLDRSGNQNNNYGQREDNQQNKSNSNSGYGSKPTDNMQKNNNADPFADKGKPIDISDDDLPF